MVEALSMGDSETSDVDSYLYLSGVNTKDEDTSVQRTFSQVDPSRSKANFCIIEDLLGFTNCKSHVSIAFQAEVL